MLKKKGKVAGSRSGEVVAFFFNLPNSSSRTKPRGLLSLYQKWVPETEENAAREESAADT
jgi:hypothetical protein